MNARILMACLGAIVLFSGCTTQTVDSSQMLVKENPPMVEDPVNNLPENVPPPLAQPPVMVADKQTPVNTKAIKCSVNGKPVMLDNMQIGINIQLGYCSANLKPKDSAFWIPETEAPALGNISVDDNCNITYCPTAPHYDHFAISNGNKTIHVQVKWLDNQPVIY